MLALDFLRDTQTTADGPLCAIYGDEEFLKREAQIKLRGNQHVDSYLGKEVDWAEVHDALTAVSLFGDMTSIVVVEEADPFVTKYRDRLEKWVAQPRGQRLLVLVTKTWPGNTRLAKAVAQNGLALNCGVPTKGRELTAFTKAAKQWLTERAQQVHHVRLEAAACERLFDLMPLSLGVLDQEVAKLAMLAPQGTIHRPLVEEQVGDWRTRQTWDMIDAMVDGRAAEALQQLDRLLAAGEVPIAILGQVGSTLRRFATAAQLVKQAEQAGRRPTLETVIEQAGFTKWKLRENVQQLRQLGRARAEQLSQWLLQADMGMKSHNSSPTGQRLELERLIVRLSSAAAPARPQTAR